ncbi:Maf family nucleotide pyrophosphatase [Parvibium lacunae]|uniref:7-methyl-GTP pyrophosphatase n=1 Tax=Parvibium lacunae TaxID=1888893 RepID=A0A368L429_9BURK|nr:Maf family nucleotide pyrophosphatase [Parvibium lacunae]RCS58243.1 septum formation protein Maf [Parvibium lacunae]
MPTGSRPPLILGSSSPYRQQQLRTLGLPFSVAKPGIDETPQPNEAPAETALRLARAKAESLATAHPNSLIIGCDQVLEFKQQPMGKPGNHAQAMLQLQTLRGQESCFHSALCLLDTRTQPAQARSVNSKTYVKFRCLDDASLAAYLHLDQPYDCAGSAKIECRGITLLEYCRADDPSALIGLPLISLCQLLIEAGYPLHPLALPQSHPA